MSNDPKDAEVDLIKLTREQTAATPLPTTGDPNLIIAQAESNLKGHEIFTLNEDVL